MFAAALPFAGAAASAFASWYGQKEANESNERIAQENREFNAREAQTNREFQERMSGSAWQRAVADMKAAGINPMVAFSQGGASSPSGSQAQGSVGSPQQSTTTGLSAAIKEALLLKANLDLIKSQSNAQNAQATNLYAQATLNSTNAQLAEANIPGSRVKSKVDSGKFAEALEYAKRLGIDFNSAVSLLKFLSPQKMVPRVPYRNYHR